MNSYKADFLIIGAGFAGSVFAHFAAEAGYSVEIIDKRNHIGGNCYSYKDEETKIDIHKYGPHIFHTNSKEIWDFINKFTEFNNYIHRVKAVYNNSVYSLPVNLHTINQLFNRAFNPIEAEQFINSIRVNNAQITNFEEFVTTSLGVELYEAFFKNYTIKQWGTDPKLIAVSTAKRLPIRFNYNDNYFNDTYQGIPIDGYTEIFNRMLHHDKITIKLSTDYDEYKSSWRNNYKYLVYSGSLDEYFNYQFGYLPYRTVAFKEIRGKEIIGTSQLNYCDLKVLFTRISEHKWFTPDKQFDVSVAFEEYSDFTDSRNEPYYPIRNTESDVQYNKYENLAKNEEGVLFIGRMAEFRYYDMHQVIGSSIAKFKSFIETIK